jgi:hypothetical protein
MESNSLSTYRDPQHGGKKSPLAAGGEKMKRFFIKLSVLAVIVFLLQMLLGKYKIEFGAFDSLNRHLKNKIDVLYLGDCTDYTVSKSDRDRRRMTRMLQDMNPDVTIGAIAHGAYQMDIYLSFCRYILEQPHRPRVIIIPVNIRSFSPEWDRMPQYQFEKEKIILEGGLKRRFLYAFYKPLMAFHYRFHRITREEYLETPVVYEGREVGKIKDFSHPGAGKFSEEYVRKKFLLFYMLPVTAEHRMAKAMYAIAKRLKQDGIELIFYLTPIDYRSGERYYPGEFTSRVQAGTALVRRLLSAEGARVLDLSTALDGDAFFWREKMYPNEQLNQKGRRYVAERLTEKLKKKN